MAGGKESDAREEDSRDQKGGGSRKDSEEQPGRTDERCVGAGYFFEEGKRNKVRVETVEIDFEKYMMAGRGEGMDGHGKGNDGNGHDRRRGKGEREERTEQESATAECMEREQENQGCGGSQCDLGFGEEDRRRLRGDCGGRNPWKGGQGGRTENRG